VACWSTTAAISLKCVKIEEKLLWRAYRNSQTLFRTVPSLNYSLLFPKVGGLQPPPKISIAIIISGNGKTADFRFGPYAYIHRVHANKSPLKIWEKRAYPYRDCPKFLSTPYYLRNG